MNIATTLEKLAHLHPHRLAIVEKTKSTTYAMLNRQVAAVADYLNYQGVMKGDTVLLYVKFSSELYALLLGINRIGAVVQFIDPTYGPKELKHCIQLAKPKAIVIDDRLTLIARLAAPLFGIRKILSLSQFDLSSDLSLTKISPVGICQVEEGDPALITFTSGSSGKPKGIVRSHGFLGAQCQVLKDELAIGSCQSEVTTLPIFVLANLASGVTSILPSSNLRSRFKTKRQVDTAQLTAQILEHLPERILAAPAFLMQVALHLQAQNIRCYFVKEVLTGGGPVFPQLLILLRAVFPLANLTTVYGSTEAEPIAHFRFSSENLAINDFAATGAGLPQGKVSAHVDLAILPGTVQSEYSDYEFESLRAPAYVIGEIAVAGRHVIEGYIDGIGNSENKIKVGSRTFHRTGDAGYLDNQGVLYLVGRAAMKIEVPGGFVYPLTVEACAMATGLVDSCAYLLINNKRVLVAKLSEKAGKEVKAKLLKCINFAHIDEVVIRNSLPMDKRHSSKILYDKLRSSLN
ncbi:MAG: AMP-binding protein [Candidatus Melainabacteria bacterium]|nr:AMP-binding protein [Candidatus Melainabacteria bacterium]